MSEQTIEGLFEGIDLSKINWGKFMDELDEEVRSKQSNCSHEKAFSFGPSNVNGQWEHRGYMCKGCGIQTDAQNHIGEYAGQRFNPQRLERSLHNHLY